MTTLLAIDPGADAGWALFNIDTGNLIQCGLGWRNAIPYVTKQPPNHCSRLVVERPHTGRTRAKKKDIITLALRAGEAAGVIRHLTGVEPEYVEPASWKGSTPKPISDSRVKKRLLPDELAVYNAATARLGKKAHNVLDAVGIGLNALHR